jgi:hypothetical protein
LKNKELILPGIRESFLEVTTVDQVLERWVEVQLIHYSDTLFTHQVYENIWLSIKWKVKGRVQRWHHYWIIWEGLLRKGWTWTVP